MAHLFVLRSRILVMAALALGVAANTGCGGSSEGGGQAGGGDDGAGGAGGSGEGGGGGSSANGCDVEGSFQACAMPGDPEGMPSGGQQCLDDGTGQLAWNACQPAGSAASTPLVFSFDDAPVAFAPGSAAFDLTGTMSVATDWPAAKTPWLALDRSGNGAIDDGSELFGSATILASGRTARHGFEALAELDSNGDGRISPDDAAWSSLRVWSDGDADRVSSGSELATLEARGIRSIDLAFTSERHCDARGNCEIERASFRWIDDAGQAHTGAVVDVHLKHQ